MKKKIVHVALRDYHDDRDYQENLLCRKQKELGYEVSLITSQLYRDDNNQKAYYDVREYINQYGIFVSVLPCKMKNNFVGIFCDQVKGLYEKLDVLSPDIIFVHNFLSRDVRHVVKYAQNHSHVKVYVDCHTDYYNSHYDTLYGKAKAFVVRREGAILNRVAIKFWGTTPWRVKFLKDVYKLPQEKVDLLVLGAEENNINNVDRSEVRQRVRAKYGIPNDVFLIITGGKLDKRKQQNILMEAVKRLKDDNIWLLVFGTPTEEMKSVIQPYERCPNIVMTGWMHSEETYPLFLASDLAFFPGTHSVLWEEAVACSTPLVVKHWEGMEHVNVNGNALMLDIISVENIINAIKDLYFSQKYTDMSIKAAQCASSFFLKEIALKSIGEE